jgi:hypothetical protein
MPTKSRQVTPNENPAGGDCGISLVSIGDLVGIGVTENGDSTMAKAKPKVRAEFYVLSKKLDECVVGAQSCLDDPNATVEDLASALHKVTKFLNKPRATDLEFHVDAVRMGQRVALEIARRLTYLF